MKSIVSFMNDQHASVLGSPVLYNDISSDEPWIRFIVGKVPDEIPNFGNEVGFLGTCKFRELEICLQAGETTNTRTLLYAAGIVCMLYWKR